ncbi:MAG: N-acetylmuramidase family protein [Salinisphaera sp.]|jgi:hypothetical protein|nr:N-acetylmuramidase family protein [Salinisphaera sp.]
MSLLRQGDRGADVVVLQDMLNHVGAAVPVTGNFGPATEQALRAYQASAHLVVDGLYGAKSRAAMAGVPLPGTLSQADLDAAAKRLGVDVASVMAVHDVESRGYGFIGHTRLPVILFERHVMYARLASRGFDAAALMHAHPQLVNVQPGGYHGGLAEHDRLDAAQALDIDSAIEATSWGTYQIMGEHWSALGYASALAFETDMCQDEAAQLTAFVRFIENSRPLHQALRAHDWRAFARHYNGPAYAKNDYDHRIAAAYRRHSPQPVAA